MRVLSLIHQENAGPGVFADAIDCEHEVASFALERPPARDPHSYDAVLVFGGSMNVDEEDDLPWLREEKALIASLVEQRRPLLGVCLGSQLVAEAGGAEVGPLTGGKERGWHELELTPAARDDPLLGGLGSPLLALEWHGYGAARGAPGLTELARNGAGLQAFRIDGAPAWGLQFHAEVDAPTLGRWIDEEEEPIDRAALADQNRRELPRWNEVGRGIARRFVELASR